MPTPIATWNTARSVWETRQTLICGHWDVFSEILPSSGMTRSGSLFELPMLVPPIDGPGCSSVPGLPTPRATAGGSATETTAALLPTTTATPYGSNQSPSPGAAVRPALATALLPTPDAYASARGGSQHPDRRKGHTLNLQDVVEHTLLPTLMARDAKGRSAPGRQGGVNLPEALLPTPTTSEATGPGYRSGSDGGNLRTIVDTLFPTPKASDGVKGGPNQKGSSGDLTLPSAAMAVSTGESTARPSIDGPRSSDG